MFEKSFVAVAPSSCSNTIVPGHFLAFAALEGGIHHVLVGFLN